MTQYAPVIVQIPAPYDANPWFRDGFERELALTPGADPRQLLADALAAHHGREEPVGSCPCGDQLWWRERTGGYKCHACLSYSNLQGVIIGVTETAREDSYV